MKKFLLFFAGIVCSATSFAQLQINEVYVRPGNNQQEYFEIVNASPAPENTGCYTLVTYFKNGSERGMYVVSMPDVTLNQRGVLTASSQAPDFSYQNGTGHADFSWNNGRIKRFLYQSGALVMNNNGMPYNDIFVRSGSGGGIYAVFLFKGSQVADVFLGSNGTNTVPADITEMGTLAAAALNGCGDFAYNFANINAENASLFGHVVAEAGTNNGYYRNEFCEWEKASSPSEQTPGAPNGNMDCSQTIQPLEVQAQCVNDSTLSFTLTAGDSRSFPVTVRTYYDANGSQFLDSGDVLINTKVLQQSDLGTAFMVSHERGQEDFLIVFDAAAWCQDLVEAVNCPAAIVLPVTLQSFSLQRSGSSVSLRWSTLTEVNNRGFYVQRQQGNGSWENVTFIPSRATGGNSTNVLTYSFNDVNSYRGITQYRLYQVDIDGRGRYSDIRSTRGEGSISKLTVYPNPSMGVANLQFGDADGMRDVQVADMSGRVVKQWRNTGSQSLQLSGLTPGIYTVRVIELRDGTQQTERLVVSGSR